MMLLITHQGVLGSALERASSPEHGVTVSGADLSQDLFALAAYKRTVLYVPSASLLDGFLEPKPDPQRMRRVLGAACAPGVEQLVVVVPRGGGYESELDVLRRDGKPYVIVECPPLTEEVARLPRDASKRARSLLRRAGIECARAGAAAEQVSAAVRSDAHGATFVVPGTRWSARERLVAAARATRDAVAGLASNAPTVFEALAGIARGGLLWVAALLLLPFALAWGLFLVAVLLPALAMLAIGVALMGRPSARAPRAHEPEPRRLEPRAAVSATTVQHRQAA